MRTIVVLMDTLRRDHLSCYNEQTDCHTDNITDFANDSCMFTNHFTGSMPCIPARRDIMTGRLNFLERSWGPIEIQDTTFPQLLTEHGIRNHIITDHAHYFRIGGENYCQQFDTYEFHRGQESDPWVSLVDEPPTPEEYFGTVKRQYQSNRTRFKEEKDYPSVKCFDSAIDWLDENKGADDFFLMVETFDPHEPFDVPQKYLDLYDDDYTGPHFDLPTYKKVDEETDEAMEHLRKRYKGLVSMTDHHFGRFIDKLKSLDMYKDTMIILTSDHGYFLGERDYIGKNYIPAYNELCNIPLLVHFPEKQYHGQENDQLTQNIDLMPTILDYFSIDIPESVTGHSFKKMLGANQMVRPYSIYGLFGLSVNIYDGQYTYMRGPKDNSKCYEYTTSLTTIRGWLGKDISEKITTGYFLPNVPFPVYRVPALTNPIVSDTTYVKEDHLFDITKDYEQTVEITDEDTINLMQDKLSHALRDHNAPAEQWERLGLKQSK